MKLWVDDIRRPPNTEEWIWARTNREAILALRAGGIEECSLDHDMGLHDFDPDQEDADMRVAPDAGLQPDGLELVTAMIRGRLVPPVVTIHSWNPVGAQRMAKTLRDDGVNATVKPYERR